MKKVFLTFREHEYISVSNKRDDFAKMIDITGVDAGF